MAFILGKGSVNFLQSKKIAQLICAVMVDFLFIFTAYRNSGSGKEIYLNSGLTSTKNYGKTILTKVLLKNGVKYCIELVIPNNSAAFLVWLALVLEKYMHCNPLL